MPRMVKKSVPTPARANQMPQSASAEASSAEPFELPPEVRVFPESYVAIEMMRHGISYDELPSMRRHAGILSDLAGIRDNSFLDGLMLNAMGHDDPFLDVDILKHLARRYKCPRALTLSSYFDREVGLMMEATDRRSGINAFVGRRSEAELHAFLDALSAHVAGRWDDIHAGDMARKHAAKLVRTVLVREMAAYREKWLKDAKSKRALFEKLSGNGALPFPKMMQKAVADAEARLAAARTRLLARFDSMRPAFSSGDLCNGETYDCIVGNVQNLLSIDAAAGYAAKAVRRWGFEETVERAKRIDMAVRETRMARTKRISVLARVASGRGEHPDVRWLAHVDKGNVFSYHVPKELQKDVKILAVAVKVAASGADADEVATDARNLIMESSLLSNMGADRPDLQLSVYCAVCRGLVAGRNFGEEDEGWRAFEALREIVPDASSISQSAPGPGA